MALPPLWPRLGWRSGLLLTGILLLLQFSQAAKPEVPGQLEDYDKQPLGKRTPLILVHGIAPNAGPYYNWGGFLTYAYKHPGFKERFKVYLFRYNPAASVAESGEQLETTLEAFLKEHPQARLKVIAHSLGGLLYRETLDEPELVQKTDQAITIGTPFHGTPLAHQDWMAAQLESVSALSPLKWTQGIAFWLTGKKFPHFAQDYCWDNYDGSLPAALAPGNALCKRPSGGNPAANVMTYSSFFGAQTPQVREIYAYLQVKSDRIPRETANGGGFLSKHQMMALVCSHMAAMPLNFAKAAGGADVPTFPLFVLNDGVSPVPSHLWLGRYVQGKANPQQAQWQTLKKMQNTHQARLFHGLDHRDWLEGNSRLGAPEVGDLLHPGEGKNTVYDWLLTDLDLGAGPIVRHSGV